eukprot:9298412-Pyramimonas_sp.AAC.1
MKKPSRRALSHWKVDSGASLLAISRSLWKRWSSSTCTAVERRPINISNAHAYHHPVPEPARRCTGARCGRRPQGRESIHCIDR